MQMVKQLLKVKGGSFTSAPSAPASRYAFESNHCCYENAIANGGAGGPSSPEASIANGHT